MSWSDSIQFDKEGMHRMPASALCSCNDRKSSGFTLVETLLALAILVLLTGIVAMGVPTAFRTYTQLVNKSEGQVVLSTVTSELRSELGLSQYVLTTNGLNKPGTVLYYVSPDGYWAQITNGEYTSKRDNKEHNDIVRKLYMSDVFMSKEIMDSMPSVNDAFNLVKGSDGKAITESLAAVQVTNGLDMELEQIEVTLPGTPLPGGSAIKENVAKIELNEKGYFVVSGLKVTDSAGAQLASVDNGDYYIQALMLKAS